MFVSRGKTDSFYSRVGWVAFAVTAVISAVGENLLMPPSDFACMVINGENGFSRNNRSWIIGRIVRDFGSWMDKQPRRRELSVRPQEQSSKPVHELLQRLLDSKWDQLKTGAKTKGKPEPKRPAKAGLCISVYRAQEAARGHPGYDAPYITGILTGIIQLGVAAIPCGLFGDWSILLVTGAGIVLCSATGALSQWSEEKWACRGNTEKTFVLTAGNGSQHAIVIQGNGVGLDFEDLAASGSTTGSSTFASQATRLTTTFLGALWIFLLISAAGIKENTWFLLAVGGIGILQNVYTAGASRSPEAFGVPLEFIEVMGEPKVMDALYEAESRYPRLGQSLLPVFFPGRLNDEEQEKWDEFDIIAKQKKLAKKEGRMRESNKQNASGFC